VPELPEMQALAERLDAALASRRLEAVAVLGFSGLKTVVPGPDDLVGRRLEGVDRRGKYLRFHFEGALTVALHLSQGGRVDLEDPPKETKPRGSVVRFSFEGPLSLLVREHGTQRKVGWWVLASGDEGPMGKLGPRSPTRRSTTCWPKVMTTATSTPCCATSVSWPASGAATPTTPSTAPGSRRSPRCGR